MKKDSREDTKARKTKVPLSEICDISSGGTPVRKNPEFFDGEIPWAKISDIEAADNGVIYATDESISEDGLKNIRGKLFPKGTLLFAMYGSIGKVAFAGRELSANQAILGIRPKAESQIELKYLKCWFESNKQRLINQGRGVALKNLSATIVRNLEIDLPPLDDQKRIAYVLGKVEGLIARRKQHLQHLDDLLKSIFLDLFGDPVRNEKGWGEREITEVCDEIVDCVNKTAPKVDTPTPYVMVRTSNIRDGRISLDNVKYVDAEVYKIWTRRSIPQPGDLLFTREAPMGEAGIIDFDTKIFLGQRIMQYRCNLNEANPKFILELMKDRYFQSQVNRLGKGSTVKHLTVPDCFRFKVISPPIDLQNQFAAIVEKVEGIKSRYQQSLTDLENLYGALSQKAFKGELDLSRVPLPNEPDTSRASKQREEIISRNEIMTTGNGSHAMARSLGENEHEREFKLPNPVDKDWLITEEKRYAQMGRWFDAYLEQLKTGDAPSLDRFFELLEESFYDLEGEYAAAGPIEYDQVKEWLFKAIEDGRIEQTRNPIEIDGKPELGNQVILKKV